jgi:hypothetical protein
MSEEEVSPIIRVGPFVLGKVEKAEDKPVDAATIAQTAVSQAISGKRWGHVQ